MPTHRPAPDQRQSWNGQAMRVALDGALGQVAAHVPAVPVEHVQLVVLGAGEHHQLGAEGVDRVRPAVVEVSRQAEAVPAAGEPLGHNTGVDRADGVGAGVGSARARLRHIVSLQPVRQYENTFQKASLIATHNATQAQAASRLDSEWNLF